jgi:hypothetical protein
MAFEELAVVIQAFVKLDTLEACCNSLLECAGHDRIDLIFWIDNAWGSRKPERFAASSRKVRDYINNFAFDNAVAFKSIQVRANDRNLGTCKTCEVALNYAFLQHQFVVFAEDDVIFSKDALIWFSNIRKLGLLSDDSVWAAAGESIFFNARRGQITPELLAGAEAEVLKNNLHWQYTYHSFIPSTCFATTREKWAEFGVSRGQPLGDVDVCKRCHDEHKRAVFPIVPRVRDIGMLHEDGFSVMIKGVENVPEVKHTYLTSDLLSGESTPSTASLIPFSGDAGLLYRKSTLLEGFAI